MTEYHCDTYEIETSEDRAIILITPKVDVDRKVAIDFRRRANKLAEELGSDKFLVDVRTVASVASSGDRFIYAYKDAPVTGFNKKFKVAMVKHPEDISHDFVVKVMTRAGFTYGLFTDMLEAEQWLRS